VLESLRALERELTQSLPPEAANESEEIRSLRTVLRGLANTSRHIDAGAGLAGNNTLIGVDRGLVYFGNVNNFSRPAVLRGRAIRDHIPEYRTIQERGLTRSDVEYHFLKTEGVSRFLRTVQNVAQINGFDLVLEEEALEGADVQAEDITEVVVDALREGE
jgi:hypothetical protein